MTLEELARHKKFITGSKIASIIELPSAFLSKYALFACMKGAIPWPNDPEKQDLFLSGQCAELGMDAYCRIKYGWDLIEGPEGGMTHPDFSYIWGLVDRLRRDPDGKWNAVIEFKNVGEYARSDWSDGPPPKYEAQVRLYSMIYDLPAVIVTCIGGNDYQVFEVPRDPEVENFILQKCTEFWNDLSANRWPTPDGHQTTAAALRERYQSHTENLIPIDSNLMVLAAKYEIGRRLEKQGIKQKEEAANQLKARLGQALGAEGSGVKVTWKNTEPKKEKFDVASFLVDRPELYTKYSKLPDPTRILRVTVGEEIIEQFESISRDAATTCR